MLEGSRLPEHETIHVRMILILRLTLVVRAVLGTKDVLEERSCFGHKVRSKGEVVKRALH